MTHLSEVRSISSSVVVLSTSAFAANHSLKMASSQSTWFWDLFKKGAN